MVKIPSALKWMLTRRARLQGERDRLAARLPDLVATIGKETAQAERRLKACQRRLAIAEEHGPGRLKALDADIAAIDAAIAMYGVDIDPSRLSPIRGQYNGWALDYGQMTRLILRALKECDGAELTTTEIALILSVESGIVLTDNEFQGFRLRVRRRMRRLVAIGAIRRIHVGKTTLEGRWAAATVPLTDQESAAAEAEGDDEGDDEDDGEA